MPTYDYVCDTCGQTFEIFHSIKDAALTDCPDATCAGHVKRKIGSGAGIIFKGSGFYQTDYRSSSYQSGAKAEKTASSSSGTSAPASGGGGGSSSTPAAPSAPAST